MGWLALKAFTGVVMAFLLLPIVTTVLFSVAASPVFVFPPTEFTFDWYLKISPVYFEALKVSLIVAAGTSVLAALVGTPAALAIVRGRFAGRRAINAFCLSPLMVPTLVIGVSAFQFMIKLYDFFGLSIGGTILAIILAQTALTLPLVIRAAIAGQAHFDLTLEEAASGLGATPWQIFWRVTLPLIAPGIASGAIFAFIMSLDDVPISLFTGGGDATTLPVKIFFAIEHSLDADVMAVATIIIGVSLVLMLALERLLGLDKFFGVKAG